MDFKDNNTVGKEPIEGIFLTPEHFEGLEEVEIVPYTGEGSTSFASKDSKGNNFDQSKMEYLNERGVKIPVEWLTEKGDIKPEMRAVFISMFIVVGNILVTEDIRRVLEEGGDMATFTEVVEERNIQLTESRLDKYGYRRVLPDGSLVEDHFRKMNLSSNPEKRVSVEELHYIVEYVITGLKEGKKE